MTETTTRGVIRARQERLLALCYRLLWPFGRTAQLNQHERHRLLHFLPDDPDPRNVLYGLVLMGRAPGKTARAPLPRWPSGAPLA